MSAPGEHHEGMPAERRRNRRFPLHLPVLLVRSGEQPLVGGGETCNFALRGVLFTSDTEVAPDQQLEYLVRYRADASAKAFVNVHCWGRVARVEPSPDEGSRFRIAATIERYQLLRSVRSL